MKWLMSDFLKELKDHYEIRRLKDYKVPFSKSVCLLRHDLDHSMDHGLRIARIEYSLGIQSTYFVLHDTKYYRDKDFIKKCLKLQDMGHEIGFHNNLLTLAIKTGCKVKDALEKELTYLKKNNINIFGLAAHGDPKCRGAKGKYTYTNYEIFEECSPPYRKRQETFRGIKLHNLKLSDYELYEAYFLPRDFYITDCRGTWRYIKGKGDEWDPKFRPHSPKFKDIMPFLKTTSETGIILQATLHPNPDLVKV